MKKLTKKSSPYGSAKFSTIDDYHVSFPADIRKILEQLRQTIGQAAPQAEEVISYNMPAFKWNGVLVYYAAYKQHIGFYPTPSPIRVFKAELIKFKTSKGAIQFPIDKPLPTALIKKIVKFRVTENSKKEKTKKLPAKDLIHYHKDGTIWAKGKMLGEEMHGYWEWFRKNGIIMRSGYFDKGKQIGEWITYDKLGKVYKVMKMKGVK
jgi:uncharacterized protein YdhG (YjbR/CyaY superfamily)